MSHRVVTISNRAYLSIDLGRLSVRQGDEIAGAIPIEDLSTVILESNEITLSQSVLAKLAEANVAVLVCDERHLPLALLQPLYGHTHHARTMRLQIECSEPKRKRIWQQIVQAKLRGQAAVLETVCRARTKAKEIRGLAEAVRSGDPDNCEAQAARIFFSAAFGADFEREREGEGANAMLNYGYAIMRAMVARALVGAGLHPAIGVFHRGPANPYNLADDAIEPLRPVVDAHVLRYLQTADQPGSLTPAIKRYLLEITVLPVRIAGIPLPLTTSLERYASNLREAICGNGRKVVAPGV